MDLQRAELILFLLGIFGQTLQKAGWRATAQNKSRSSSSSEVQRMPTTPSIMHETDAVEGNFELDDSTTPVNDGPKIVLRIREVETEANYTDIVFFLGSAAWTVVFGIFVFFAGVCVGSFMKIRMAKDKETKNEAAVPIEPAQEPVQAKSEETEVPSDSDEE